MAISYYPRLTDAVAITIITEMNNIESINDIQSLVTFDHEMAFHDAVATGFVTRQELQELRSKVLAVAQAQGFPGQASKNARRTFDQQVSEVLDESIDLLPAEAANREIWNFLTLVVMPDIAAWRYPNDAKKLTFERWLGTDRNVFRKLWWREVTLGSKLNRQLGEDEAVALMERPGLSGNPLVARAIAQSFLDVAKEFDDQPRSELMRAISLNVRKHLPLLNFEYFTEDELTTLFSDIARQSCEQFVASQSSS
ncbi:hypothetical protein [uncultured Corynebacterium sp.]|uniref:hypothetical protein n=1 Tax=uncultured Corynebacterium sp. TaxID=159447 RepID=UPI0026010E93|nr:hypothetical protein [uncultured Corynebacterium sp.]